MNLDGSVYPDLDEPPEDLPTDEDKADYLSRVCAAWDHGVMPDRSTFELFRGWRTIFERFPVSDSPSFHAFCQRFGWPHGEGRVFRAKYEILDQREGRVDPCADMI
jgi:hypothetical protein